MSVWLGERFDEYALVELKDARTKLGLSLLFRFRELLNLRWG